MDAGRKLGQNGTGVCVHGDEMDERLGLFDEPQWCVVEMADGRSFAAWCSEIVVGESVFLQLDHCVEREGTVAMRRLVHPDAILAIILADSMVPLLGDADVPETAKGKSRVKCVVRKAHGEGESGVEVVGKESRESCDFGNLIIGDFGNYDETKCPF